MKRGRLGVLAFVVAIAACSETADSTAPDVAFDAAFTRSGAPGHVYTMTNSATGNEVLAFRRVADGRLEQAGAWATGGVGTGAGLGNQGGLIMANGGRWLFVVNAGDHSVSVFARAADGSLSLSDRVSSGGTMPVSVTRHEDMVYVLNAGGDGGIAGFHFARGKLHLIPGSERPLSQAAPGPAQIEFVRNGSQLVVTEKGTNRIVVYNVDRRTRLASDPIVNPSAGATPFGFAFDNAGHLIVSNAAGGAAGAGSLTSYAIRSDGTLAPIAVEVPNFQGAPCWVVVSRNGRFAYTTNTASNTTTGYSIADRGGLRLLDPSGVSGLDSGSPIDAAVSQTGDRNLYVLNGSAHAIDAFVIGSNGSLASLGTTSGLPVGANGLVAW